MTLLSPHYHYSTMPMALWVGGRSAPGPNPHARRSRTCSLVPRHVSGSWRLVYHAVTLRRVRRRDACGLGVGDGGERSLHDVLGVLEQLLHLVRLALVASGVLVEEVGPHLRTTSCIRAHVRV